MGEILIQFEPEVEEALKARAASFKLPLGLYMTLAGLGLVKPKPIQPASVQEKK